MLDVGTGSSILAIWSAQAGAWKVYAVEATKMYEHACLLVKANGLEGIVEVIEGSMEDVTLPEKGCDFSFCSLPLQFWHVQFHIMSVDICMSSWCYYIRVDGVLPTAWVHVWFCDMRSRSMAKANRSYASHVILLLFLLISITLLISNIEMPLTSIGL